MRSFRHVVARTFFFLCAVIFYFSSVSIIHAATLSVAPTSVSVHTGDVFTVSVRVNSSAEAINAVSAKLIFPKQLLQATGISKTGSILNFWVQDPTVSNTFGTVSFEGVAVNPGYIGASGKVASVSFRALKEGTADLILTQASVLANDGAGTNVLSSVAKGVVVITKSIPVAPPTSPLIPEPVVEIPPPVVVPPPTPEPIFVTITTAPAQVQSGSHFFIKGSTNTSSPLTVYVQNIDQPFSLSPTIEYEAPSTDVFDDSFSAKVEKDTFTAEITSLSRGSYAFFAKSGDGAVSNIVLVVVSGGFWSKVWAFILLWWYIPFLLLLLLLILLLLRKIIKSLRERSQNRIAYKREHVFPAKTADRYTTLLQKIELGVPLNLEERLFVQKLKQYLHTGVDTHQN